MCRSYDPPLDEGIKEAVKILADNDIETYESCQGGKGHAYFEPTVRFHGGRDEGFKALSIVLANRLKPSKLSRIWTIQDGEPCGPNWEMTFNYLPCESNREHS